MESEPAAASRKPRASRPAKRKAGTILTDPPAPKRSRTTKKGSLQRLLDISLDVLFEIFGHLQPLDVLRLGRVSKEFRQLLFHKSSISIWRSCLANVPGLPSCPPSMTEPQWVSLVFDQTCQVCQKIARKVDWGLLIRICSKCIKTNIGISMLKSPTAVVHFIDLVLTRPDNTKPWKTVYFIPELARVKAIFEAMNSEEEAKFVEDRKEILEDLKERAALCKDWAEDVANHRTFELADLKEERFNAISAKLTGLGWGEELAKIHSSDSLKLHKLVKQPHVLTERTWNTIKPEMIRYMEEMKAKRLVREHAALVVQRKAIAAKVFLTYKRSQLPWTDVMPGPADFYLFPEIAAILKAPLGVDVDAQTFEGKLSEFPAMIATWREGILKEVAAKYDELEGKDADAVKAHLKLATSVYKCSSCATDRDDGIIFSETLDPLFWPRVLEHRCLTRVMRSSSWMMMFSDMRCDAPWRASPLKVDPLAAEIVENVVRACGLDPKTATVEDLDTLDPRLACYRCAQRKPAASTSTESSTSAKVDQTKEGPATVKGFNWRNAVRHEGKFHDRIPTAWHLLNATETEALRGVERALIAKARVADDKALNSGDQPMPDAPSGSSVTSDEEKAKTDAPAAQDEAFVRAEEIEANHLPSSIPDLAWSCALCMDTPRDHMPMSLGYMLDHVASSHKIRPGVLNEHYYRAPAAPEVYASTHFPSPTLEIESLPPAPPIAPRKTLRRTYPAFDHIYHDIYGGYDSSDHSDSDDGYGYGYGYDPWEEYL